MARKPRRQIRPKAVTGETVVTVMSSAFDQEESNRRVLEVSKFEVDPAYVRASAGVTKNLGNYESLRVDVAITLPCYIPEIEEVHDRAAGMVADLLAQEVERFSNEN